VDHDTWLAAQSKLSSITDRESPYALLGLLRQLMADDQFYPSVDYNLACMYSRALATESDVEHGMSHDDMVDAGYRHLARAVERPDRLLDAERDDAFSALRAARPEEFWDLVTSRVPPADRDLRIPTTGEAQPDGHEPRRSRVPARGRPTRRR
jgi:hypothetical protein